jgi:translation initiation factor 2 beta subunit (eIF-2beta)/eIF-5
MDEDCFRRYFLEFVICDLCMKTEDDMMISVLANDKKKR